MIEFDACNSCLTVLVAYETGEDMSDNEVNHIPYMTKVWPELSEQISFIEIDESDEWFSHLICEGCNSPLSGTRRHVKVHSPKD